MINIARWFTARMRNILKYLKSKKTSVLTSIIFFPILLTACEYLNVENGNIFQKTRGITFFSTVSYYVWAGEISNLVQEKSFEQAQKILKKSSLLCILSTLTIASFLWFYAAEILFFFNESYVKHVFLLRASIIVFILKSSFGLLHPMYYILGDQAFLGKLQWSIGILFTILVILTVPIYGLNACIFSLIFCESFYVLITSYRLKVRHNLSILPI